MSVCRNWTHFYLVTEMQLIAGVQFDGRSVALDWTAICGDSAHPCESYDDIQDMRQYYRGGLVVWVNCPTPDKQYARAESIRQEWIRAIHNGGYTGPLEIDLKEGEQPQ